MLLRGQSSPQEKTMDHVKNIAHVFQSECLTKLVFVSQVRAKFPYFKEHLDVVQVTKPHPTKIY